METPRRLNLALALGAFALGCARGAGLPATSDALFLLLRAGNSLGRFSLDAYALPPGGAGAPPLGAALVAAGAALRADPEPGLLVAGALVLGAAAGLVTWVLGRLFGPAAALVGAATVILPPFFATGFTRHPDAGLAGTLIAAAIAARLLGASSVRSAAPAWLAVLASPWALPAALAIQLHDPGALRRVGAWLMPATVILVVAALSVPLPEISRGAVLHSVFAPVGPPFAAVGSTLEAVRRIWVGGVLLAVPAALSFRLAPAGLRVPWLALVAVPVVLAGPGAFAAATAAFVPTTALLLATIAASAPDRAASSGVPRRPLLAAMLVPVLLLAIFSAADRRERDAVRLASARDTQVGLHLWESLEEPGPLQASRPGALAFLTDRAVLPIEAGLVPPWPTAVVFAGWLAPADEAERRILAHPQFLAAWTPWEFDRTTGQRDGVWRRVRNPERVATPPEGYSRAVLRGLELARADPDEARRAFADAAALEPPPLGLAHERWGVLLEAAGESDSASVAFMTAIRDPWTVVARGHLADRLLSAGEMDRADTLISEAAAVAPALGTVLGTQARAHAFREDGRRALAASEAAVQAAPTDPRILVNHGTLLWAAGDSDAAREFWRRARHLDRGVVRFLGNFEAAADTSVAPPLIPLFSRVGFLEPRPDDPVSAGAPSSAPPPPAPR